ncbi:phosphoribosyltransferase-like protein [Rhizobium phage RHph_TM40]|uniref:Phosphoribosyltransferase-like protein n=2 Tax=Cuauhnahuacvirus TaxID=3044696 RepID=A0A7S5RI37_9CAUD|nr:phosphoribosyltransferase-like protein [Rhizobium phage RHph_TM30]YP_010671160.1 phosphoribosyltransferase-like protein [Rhizobium phage RHph_Y65]QIG71482.1 phosphoribosyltransferase-like protein [Rhizobium phage RHph_TM40]QIG71845.1 phosphoribosyltransferase-like protein [Rhizobium phage RHph_TM2_3B]QIG72207.1 phosphoribosyltransferase-like protein [Rhizobium phage RHph_TM3_3_6]QIG77340.1 phosphoribosyltransferase-like protein [Rhizobium phage RHph_TM21B]QIG77598.1 phosphoribosyltransfera
MNNHQVYYAHKFTSMEDLPFDAVDYCALKFGSDEVARRFGYELAEKFFEEHSSRIVTNHCAVIPSPYNFVPNAATILSKHFINRLNELIVEVNGDYVDYVRIHRKVTYTGDFGKLNEDARRKLIGQDSFYVNKQILKNKLLIYLDDVIITGAHEDRLKEVMVKNKMKNDCFFVYYGKYFGTEPTIENKINFGGIETVEDYVNFITDRDHLIVRPIKYLLSLPNEQFKFYLNKTSRTRLEELFHSCLGEGYNRIPQYQENFVALRDQVKYLSEENRVSRIYDKVG